LLVAGRPLPRYSAQLRWARYCLLCRLRQRARPVYKSTASTELGRQRLPTTQARSLSIRVPATFPWSPPIQTSRQAPMRAIGQYWIRQGPLARQDPPAHRAQQDLPARRGRPVCRGMLGRQVSPGQLGRLVRLVPREPRVHWGLQDLPARRGKLVRRGLPGRQACPGPLVRLVRPVPRDRRELRAPRVPSDLRVSRALQEADLAPQSATRTSLDHRRSRATSSCRTVRTARWAGYHPIRPRAVTRRRPRDTVPFSLRAA
jgi:hypothetical protein